MAGAPSGRLVVSVLASPAYRTRVRGLGAWLERAAPRSAVGDVHVALVSDARMRAMNRRFRRVDQATDVLSFPAGDGGPGAGQGRRELGEIAIATGVAARQARRAAHAFGVEARILALHGLLHLLGYDHDTDQGEMRRIEARLGRKAGLPAGLIERSPDGSTAR